VYPRYGWHGENGFTACEEAAAPTASCRLVSSPMSGAEAATVPRDFAAGGAALVELAAVLSASSSLEQLEHAFAPRFGRLVQAPMYGFYALDPEGSEIEHNVAVNVSDVFVARYVRVMEDDMLLARSRETGRAVYNLGVMPEAEWEDSRVYRDAYATHKIRHVVEVPIVAGDEIIGALHCAASESDRNFTDEDLRLTEAVAGVLALSIVAIRSRNQREDALEEALAALELTATAVVTSNPLRADLTMNAAARRLMDDVIDGEDHLYRLLARRPGDGRVSRRTEVSLRSGERALLHAHSQPVRHDRSVTVLELQREHPGLNPRLLAALTPREGEVAVLVVEGMGDREIAEALHLSRFTVQQHVKRIYRTLGVDSRVALTRLLLGAPIAGRRS
jgi:DNA-binding CsgD family transcriptional regulator/GAF domain-containing protein